MKFRLILPMVIITILSCGNPMESNTEDILQPDNQGQPETTVDNSFIGTWVSSFYSHYEFDESTYQRTFLLDGHSNNGYADKGSLTYTDSTITIVKEYVREGIDGTWESSAFDFEFVRDLESYNQILAGYGYSPITADEFWEANYHWSIERDNDPYSAMTPYYGGYTTGMSLEEYRAGARISYTESLTRVFTWEINSFGDLWLIEDGYGFFLSRI